MRQRVQKIIAQSGLCSRRKAEELIEQGLVKVNDVVVSLGDQADERSDTISVNDKPLVLDKKIYYVVHKPKEYISSAKDHLGRKTVLGLVPKHPRVFSVGRLDKDTTGLLLLTNDGEFANRITHPRYETDKTYIAILDKEFERKDQERLKKGVRIEGKLVSATTISLQKKIVAITVHTGIHKVVKRLFKACGYYVKKLHRTHIGALALDVPVGMFRELSEQEKDAVFKKADITKQTFKE